MEPEELVEVWRGRSESEARIVRSLLAAAGIRSMVRGESTRLTHPVSVSRLGDVRILVRAEDAERARDRIDNPGDAESGWESGGGSGDGRGEP